MRQTGVDQTLVGDHALGLHPAGGGIDRQHLVEAAHVQAAFGQLSPIAEQVGGVLGQPEGGGAVFCPQRLGQSRDLVGVRHR